MAGGQSASLGTNDPKNRTPTIWGSKCPLGTIFRGANEEIEGLCPPGLLWRKPYVSPFFSSFLSLTPSHSPSSSSYTLPLNLLRPPSHCLSLRTNPLPPLPPPSPPPSLPSSLNPLLPYSTPPSIPSSPHSLTPSLPLMSHEPQVPNRISFFSSSSTSLTFTRHSYTTHTHTDYYNISHTRCFLKILLHENDSTTQLHKKQTFFLISKINVVS